MMAAPFCRLPLAALIDPDLTDLDRQVLGVIAFFDFDGAGCWRSQRSLAVSIERHHVNVSRSIAKLIERGYLITSAHSRNRRLTVYHVNYDPSNVSVAANNPLREYLEDVSRNGGDVSRHVTDVSRRNGQVAGNKSKSVLKDIHRNTSIEGERAQTEKVVWQGRNSEQGTEFNHATTALDALKQVSGSKRVSEDLDWSKDQIRIAAWQTGILNQIARDYPADEAARIKEGIHQRQQWALDIWDATDAKVKARKAAQADRRRERAEI
jgi:hypothetical protein